MARTVRCPCGRSLPRPQPGGSVSCPACGKSIWMPVAGPGASAPQRNWLPWTLGLGALLSVTATAAGLFYALHRPAPDPGQASDPETPEERYALAREAFSAGGPAPADETEAGAVRAVENLVRGIAASGGAGFASRFDVARFLAEMEAGGRVVRTRVEEPFVLAQLVEGLTEDVATLGWEETRVARVDLRRNRREADVWARVRGGRGLKNWRFRLVWRDREGWKVYDWDDLEQGDRLSLRWRATYVADKRPEDRASYDRSSAAMGELIRQAGEGKHRDILEGVAKAMRPPPHPEYAAGFDRMEGDALSGLGRNEEALAAYGRALAARPDFPLVHHLRGRALNSLGRHEESAKAQQEFLRQVGDDAQVLLWLGSSLEALGREDEAAESYRRGAASDPADAEQRLRLGRLFLKRSDLPAALGVLREGVDADASRYEEAADVLRGGRAWDELLQLAAVILAKQPTDTDALLDRGRALRRLGQPRAAIEALHKGYVEIDGSEDALDHVEELACAAAALGRIKESLEWVEKIKESEPDSVRYRYTRARFRAAAGRADEALQDVDAVLQDEPSRHEEMACEPLLEPLRDRLKERLARAKERQGFQDEAGRLSGGPDWEKLLALARARMAVAPKESDPRYWEGYALRRLGRHDEAERALRSAGEGWGARWELALALAHAGKTADALKVAATFEPEEDQRSNGLYLRLYALTLAGLPEAAATLERLLRDDPKYALWIESEPVFEELRKRPGVRQLLEKAKESGDR